MRPDEWNQIRALLDEALQADPGRRAALLDERCQGRPELRRAVEELLRACGHASLILQSWDPRTEDPTVIDPGDRRYVPGTSIGHFRILELVGEGAFGEVYAADQTGEIKRRVALKILKPGLDSRGVMARFELEREILALVDHPNIAKIYEAGTTPSGRPYFSMEFVSGVPITEHCDSHRLGITERLQLFAEVCDALQHAHQKGIIHRDVKPSNVLVEYQDEKAVPKIIDFGVAKALNRSLAERTIYTQNGQLVGTFAYMSPEQARLTTQDVDTRSDIYSLGVMLYELLTGLKPLDDETLRQAALDEKLRMIREQEPARPSTKLTSGVHSVDTADCARRRRTSLHALTHMLQGDLDWITMCALEKERSRRYKSASEFAADIRRYVANEPISVGAPSLSYRLGKFVRRNRAAVIAGGLMAAVLLVATVATTASIVDGRRARSDAGRLQSRDQVEQAKLLIDQYPDEARTLLEDAARNDPGNHDARIEMARVDWKQGKLTEALARVEGVFEQNPESGKAAALLAGLTAAADPERSQRYRAIAEQLLADAELHYALGIAEPDRAQAVEHLSTALTLSPWMFDALWERALRLRALARLAESDELKNFTRSAARRDVDLAVLVRPNQPMTHILRGAVLLDQGDNQQAIAALTRAVDLRQDWIAYFNRGLGYARQKQFEAALADFEAGLRLAPEEIRLHREHGRAAYALQRFSEAADSYGRVVELGDTSRDARWDLGDALLLADRFQESDGTYSAAIDQAEQAADSNLPYLLSDRGHVRMLLGQLEAAEKDLSRALELDPNEAHTHMNVCHLLLRQARYAESVPACERGVELKPDRPVYGLKLGVAYWVTGQLPRALEELQAYGRRAPDDAVRIPLWEGILQRLMHNPAGAEAAWRQTSESEEAVVRALSAFMAGTAAPDTVLAAAETDLDRFTAEVFLGLQSMLDGDPSSATPRFERALEMNFRRHLEYDLTQWAQRRLPTAPN